MDTYMDHAGPFDAVCCDFPPIGRGVAEAFAYVVGFASGVVKVGMTADPASRMWSHQDAANTKGAEIVRLWISTPHPDARQTERNLIAFCRSESATREAREWFTGIDVEAVVSYAKDLNPGGNSGLVPQPTGTQLFLDRRPFERAFQRIATNHQALTVRETAQALGVPLATMSDILTAKRPCNTQVVVALVRLGFGIDDLDAVLRPESISHNRGGNRRAGRPAPLLAPILEAA